jgi:hypothetical protein
MSRSAKPISALVAAADNLARSRPGRSAYLSWTAVEPTLAGYMDAAVVIAEARAAEPCRQDQILTTLLHLGKEPDNDLALLAVVAILSRPMGATVARWSRCGIGLVDLDELEADLVGATWEAAGCFAARIASGELLPVRVGLALLDRAREQVRAPRRRQRRADRLRVEQIEDTPADAAVRPVLDELAVQITAAVRNRRLSLCEARPVYVTRVMGYGVAEAADRLGCSPAGLRAVRSRAERRLVGAAA